ncbi:MAG: hypothetical protein KJ000_05835 [Pirellulaceae bacterium]|nr:hypothetical protein [Pirellulaceae bacterium]
MAKKKAGKRSASRAKAVAADALATGAAESCVTLRIGSGRNDAIRIPCGPVLQEAAMRWSYIVRNRQRWREDAASGNAPQGLSKRSRELLVQELHVSEAFLARIAQQGLVEVCVPFRGEQSAWEARVFPWEYMLSAATKADRNGADLMVVRRLERKAVASEAVRSADEIKAAVVVAAPGAIGDAFDFNYERGLPRHKLRIETEVIENPRLIELPQQLSGKSLIHIAGLDLHQGSGFVELTPAQARKDGMLLAGQDGQPVAADADEVATAVGVGHPMLAVYNLHHSAGRIAALTVARGADAAIGFQDTIDDSMAEQFLADLYAAWRMADSGGALLSRDVPLAFATAFRLLREYRRPLRGSCIVLWSAQSLFSSDSSTRQELDSRARELAKRILHDRAKIIPLEGRTLADALVAQCLPKRVINFASLHNNQPLFDEFWLMKYPEGTLADIDVEVELHTGAQAYPYRASLTLKEDVLDLAAKVTIPLTWMRDGGFDESVRSSLRVRVSAKGQPVLADTYAVTLLPPDEWEDSDENRQWLPSFVYPRDPAVKAVLQAAQPFLMSLTDRAAAGFDGYQCIDPQAEAMSRSAMPVGSEPVPFLPRSDDDPCAGVDLQVRAIWCALVYQMKLHYINPPPGYVAQTQRLRTPAEVLAEGRGTCIDLALLLAACCEYVDVHPVIVLLEGHAFPGYWRSEQAHEDFVRIRDVEPDSLDDVQSQEGQRYAWVLEGLAGYREVKNQVLAGNLALLESTWLTQGSGFAEAEEEGLENLRVASEFHSMIDILLARRHGITPLPIRGARP